MSSPCLPCFPKFSAVPERKESVEFALHPQHETSFESEKQPLENFNHFRSKFRKRIRILSIVSLNSNDKEEVLEHQSYSRKQTEFKGKDTGTK